MNWALLFLRRIHNAQKARDSSTSADPELEVEKINEQLTPMGCKDGFGMKLYPYEFWVGSALDRHDFALFRSGNDLKPGGLTSVCIDHQ